MTSAEPGERADSPRGVDRLFFLAVYVLIWSYARWVRLWSPSTVVHLKYTLERR